MALNIIDDVDPINKMNNDGTYPQSKGGTETMAQRIKSLVEEMGLSDVVEIFHSRVGRVDKNKVNILVNHDTWNDPAAEHLEKKSSRDRFAKIVFVSEYQMATFNMGLGVPYGDSLVLKNAIDPIENVEKQEEQIRLIYHTTPHRGLNIATAAIEKLAEKYGDKIHFDVFSSFGIYGWKERDKPFESLFERIDAHPNMTYHGFQPNEVVREALSKSHIFAFPSIWPETSCIAAMEAMSAGCEIVCPNLAALPETTMGLARMYQFHEDMNIHANIFAGHLNHAIENIFSETTKRNLTVQRNFANIFYDWKARKEEWASLLSILTR